MSSQETPPRFDLEFPGESDQPSWYSLCEVEKTFGIYETNTRPLDPIQLEQAAQTIFAQALPERIRPDAITELREQNKAIIDSCSDLIVILDGRIGLNATGYLGDMIEASRSIEVLSQEFPEKNISILTPSQSIFNGQKDIPIKELPELIAHNVSYPYNIKLREYIAGQYENPTVFFPLSGRMPIILQLNPNGAIANEDTVQRLKEIHNPSSKSSDILTKFWARHGYHQIHALQTNLYMLGIDPDRLNYIPPVFIYPNEAALYSAQSVLQNYKCIDESGKTIFFHPGVAPDAKKVQMKYYSPEQWIETFKELKAISSDVNRIAMFLPLDRNQADDARKLSQTLRTVGYETTLLPLNELKEQYNWSLATFFAFLQGLGESGKCTIVGCDSMPAGHAGPALGLSATVLGNWAFPPIFYSPVETATVVLPNLNTQLPKTMRTSAIDPNNAAIGILHTLR